MPVYRAVDKHELVCGFHEEQEDTLEKLLLHQRVIIGREVGFGCGLWINPGVSLEKYEPKDETRRHPRCIAAWLPVLWRFVGRITAAQILSEEPLHAGRDSPAEPPSSGVPKLDRLAKSEQSAKKKGREGDAKAAKTMSDADKGRHHTNGKPWQEYMGEIGMGGDDG
jgi:hypothetical protein